MVGKHQGLDYRILYFSSVVVFGVSLVFVSVGLPVSSSPACSSGRRPPRAFLTLSDIVVSQLCPWPPQWAAQAVVLPRRTLILLLRAFQCFVLSPGFPRNLHGIVTLFIHTSVH